MSSQKLTILITGSNQGLGFEAARHLSKQPHVHLFVSGRNPSRVEEAVQKIIQEEGCKAIVDSVIIDVSDDASIQAGVQEVEKKLDGAALDVLVNNSALAFEKELATIGLRAVLEKTFAVNSFGAAVTADAFLPLLKRSTAGPRIVNVGSTAGSLTVTSRPDYNFPPHLGYGGSKAALNSFTCALAKMHPDIHVVVLCPGYNSTNLNSYAGTMDPKDGSMIIVEHALERKGNSPGFYNSQGEIPW